MEDMRDILLKVLDAAEKKDYSGYSKFDALNSPLLESLSLKNKWLRLIYTQIIKEMPLNLRPLLAVIPSRNPKGIALSARAYFFLYQQTQNLTYLEIINIAIISEMAMKTRLKQPFNISRGSNIIIHLFFI